MSKKFFPVITCLFFLFPTLINSQTPQDQFITTPNNDTIRNIKIVQKSRLTNEDQVTYIGSDRASVTKKASSISSYFDGNQKYISTYVTSDNSYKLLNYQVIGYLQFAQSFESNGKPVYYYLFGKQCIDLSNHKNQLEKFIAGLIPEYNEFQKNYQKKIFYDFKSLAEFASAYNTYSYPDKYVFVKYQNKEALSTSIFLSLNFSSLNLEEFKPVPMSGFDIGLNLEYKYSPYSSLLIQPCFSHYAGSNTVKKVKLNTIKLNTILAFTIYTHRSIELKAGPGIGFYYNVNSIMTQSDTVPGDKTEIKFRPPGIIYDFNIITKFNQHHTIMVFIEGAGIKTKETTLFALPDTEKKGRYFEVGFGYGFNF